MTRVDRIGIGLCLTAILAGVATLLTDQWPATYALAGFNVVVSAAILNLIVRAAIRERAASELWDKPLLIASLILFGDRG